MKTVPYQAAVCLAWEIFFAGVYLFGFFYRAGRQQNIQIYETIEARYFDDN